MKTITLSTLNLKGGCCKTTTAINLCGVMHDDGHRPLLIDIDPQKSAINWTRQSDGKFPYPVEAIEVGKSIKKFKETLDRLVKQHKADVVLFDCPPALGDPAFIAALLSDLVLIPTTANALDVMATKEAIETIKEARKERKGALPKAILIPSRLIKGTLLAKEIGATLQQFGEVVFEQGISQKVAISEACCVGLPVNLYQKNGQSHKEFINLMKFVKTHLRK